MQKIKLKIKRAKEHIDELQTELNSFLKTKPYKIEVKRDPKTKKPIYFISEASDVPIKVALITGEVVQNLRSALDHLAYRLFKINTPNGDEGRHIYFPISDDLVKYEEEKKRQTRGISQKAKDLIDSFTPYKGGNDALWRIHRLNNIDKHRLLVTVGASFGSLDLGEHMTQFMKKAFPKQAKNMPKLPAMFIKPADELFPLKVGDELFIDAPNAKEIPDMQFRIDILIYEKGIIEGQTVVGALQFMIEETEKIILAFEAFITE